MTKEEDYSLGSGLNGNPPASAGAIEDFERETGKRLPDEYLRFLKRANGGEGFVGANAYVILWPVERLSELNEAYEVKTWADGLLVFGSDGGGEAFGFDTRTWPPPVVSIPFVGMSWDVATKLAADFDGFMAHLSRT